MDYLKIYEKFKDVKEVKDYIDDVNTLRRYYRTGQFALMQEHIRKLTIKYFIETLAWNSVNTSQPTTIEQSYLSAENFLQMQGAIILTKKVKDYASYLTQEENAFIQSLSGNVS